MIASTVLGGGIGPCGWVINAQVPPGYARLDPDAHLRQIALQCGMTGRGAGMLTAALVGNYRQSVADGVAAVATVGLGGHRWTASGETDKATVPSAGTINVIAAMPVPLTDAALVNTVITVTEAKTQALLGAGLPCTGTPTDAVCVAVPATGTAVPFAGPRSEWGARLARAVYCAVGNGAIAWLRDHTGHITC